MIEPGRMGSTVYVVIPVLNEAANVERLIAGLRATAADVTDHRFSFILVDDGSTDDTGTIAARAAAGLDFRVLRHPTNRGPGAAFGTGFEDLAICLRDEDWVVTMEGDNTSRHELLRRMLYRTLEGCDVVLASPYMYGGGLTQTTPLRVFLSHVANAFVKELLGIHGILTMSSFYRLYRGSVIRRLQASYGNRVIERTGFESMIELLLKMIYLGVSITEVPMVLDTSRRRGKSKMRILPTVWGYLTIWKDKRRWRLPTTGVEVTAQELEA